MVSRRSLALLPLLVAFLGCDSQPPGVSATDSAHDANPGSTLSSFSQANMQRLPPSFVRAYQSSPTASPSQQLTFRVVSGDPDNSALTFSWDSNAGLLGVPSGDPTQSHVSWMAPPCFSGGTAVPTLTATVKDASNRMSVQHFTVSGLPSCGAPGWTATGNLTLSPLSNTQALRLLDGTVLLVRVDGALERYNPSSGTWSLATSMSGPRSQATATLLPDGRVLVVGGANSSQVLATAELYDPASNTWQATGTLSAPRAGHTAVLLPTGKVLVAGGSNRTERGLSSTELFDPATGTWSATGSMVVGLWSHAAALLPGGKVLVAGGSDPSTNFSTRVQVYDPVSGTWSTTGSLLTPRMTLGMTSLSDGRVLVAGGLGPTTAGQYVPLATAELYDPTTGTWSSTGAMAFPYYTHAVTRLSDGRVLVTGRPESWGASGMKAELYDPAAGTWTATASPSEVRAGHTATLLTTGQVLVAGGTNSRTTVLYTP